MNPQTLDKYIYIQKTPTWLVRSFYAAGLIAWGFVVWGYLKSFSPDPMYEWVLLPMIGFFTLYTVSNFGLNLFYKQFDLSRHLSLLASYWQARPEPTVDIFLPICGEDTDILKHTWKYVARLNYTNKKVYVLDDSHELCEEHERIANEYGFIYLERPNKGEMKKAGNLKYAYERTAGEYIVIFDADFAPRSDFLHELLPYMADPKVGIVQSPQYFEMTERIHKRSMLEYGAAHIQECFYRFIQVVRDRFGATICCGTNAIYRRTALETIGGPVQSLHSEDQRTGFVLQSSGWIVRYVPVIVAVGLCPDNIYTYFHQQHRWCAGNIELMASKDFWTARVSWQAKYCYATGFLFYLHHLLVVVLSFQLFWWLLFYNQNISLANGVLFYPYLIFAVAYVGFFPIARFRWGMFYALFICLYTYCHSIVATLLNRSVGWVATGAKQTGTSPAFKQTTIAVGVYILLYVALIWVAITRGELYLFNYNYYSVEFWLFYNLACSLIIFWQMYAVILKQEARSPAHTQSPLPYWYPQIKTVGVYAAIIIVLFGFAMQGNVLAQSTPPIEASDDSPAALATPTQGGGMLLQDTQLGSKGSDVQLLQRFLNTSGYAVAQSGPGSLGKETTYFGGRTYQALLNFQKDHNLDPTGALDLETRSVINFLITEHGLNG